MNIFPSFIGLVWVYNRIYVWKTFLEVTETIHLLQSRINFTQVIPDKCSSNCSLKSAVSELSFLSHHNEFFSSTSLNLLGKKDNLPWSILSLLWVHCSFTHINTKSSFSYFKLVSSFKLYIFIYFNTIIMSLFPLHFSKLYNFLWPLLLHCFKMSIPVHFFGIQS